MNKKIAILFVPRFKVFPFPSDEKITDKKIRKKVEKIKLFLKNNFKSVENKGIPKENNEDSIAVVSKLISAQKELRPDFEDYYENFLQLYEIVQFIDKEDIYIDNEDFNFTSTFKNVNNLNKNLYDKIILLGLSKKEYLVESHKSPFIVDFPTKMDEKAYMKTSLFQKEINREFMFVTGGELRKSLKIMLNEKKLNHLFVKIIFKPKIGTVAVKIDEKEMNKTDQGEISSFEEGNLSNENIEDGSYMDHDYENQKLPENIKKHSKEYFLEQKCLEYGSLAFLDFCWAEVRYEGIKDTYLLQEKIPMFYEYRIAVINNKVISGAGCIEECTPLNNESNELFPFDNKVRKVRNDFEFEIEKKQELIEGYVEYAKDFVEKMQKELPEMKNYTLDLCVNFENRITVVEINPMKNWGFFAIDLKSTLKGYIEQTLLN